MAKRFISIFFIVIAIALFLIVGFVMLLFLAPGFSAFGLRYIAYGTRQFDSGKLTIRDEIGSFDGVVLNTKEIPVYVCYSQGTEIEIRYFENFSGLTRSKIENPSIDVEKNDKGNAVVTINEYEKFIFQNANTEKYVRLYIPLQMVNTAGSAAYRTDITLNLGKSNLVFEKDEGGADGDLRIPTHRNVTVKTDGKVEYKTEVRAKKYTYETDSSIKIGKDKLGAINAEDYTLVSGGKITIEREVTGDVRATTNDRNLKLISCKNLYAKTGHGHILSFGKEPIDVFGIVKIETKTGNVVLGEVNGDGENSIITGSGNVTIKKIKDGKITTKRGSVKVNSVRDMKISTSMGKVVVEEALSKINVYSHRGKITVGGEGMTVSNPTLESRLGKVSLTSATGTVFLKTTRADIDFVNTNSSSIEIYSGGKTTAKGLQGEVKIDSAKNASLYFNNISGNTTIKLGDKCETLNLYATHNNASETRYIISGKNVTMYEDDLNDDVAAYKMDSKPEFTNKLNGSGPLLDVVGKKTNIYAYFKIENSATEG
ncbi:MAG: hypothetical protein J6J33_05780 [Clostridia bacterium]|nr:hypothetical protein [Clostridia bacterium]